MNRAEFNERYELLKEVGGGGGSFHALSAGGAVVMVHFLGVQDEPETQAVLEKVSRLEPAESRRVLEVVDVEGRAVVVTKFITDFSSLPNWLESRVAAGPPDRPPPAPAAPPLNPAPPTAPPPVSGPDRPPAKPQGEFTRMFGSRGGTPSDDLEDWEKADTKKHRPAPAPEPPEPPPPPASGPGEFTRMFTSGAPPEPPPSSDPPRPPPLPDPPDRDPWTSPPPAPLPPELPGSQPEWWGPLESKDPPPPKETGAFTRLFRSAQGSSAPPPPPPPQRSEPPAEKPLAFEGDSYQDRLKGPEQPAAQGPPPPRPSTRAPTPSGPGAYTRVIQGPATPSAPPPSAPAPPPPPTPEPEPKPAAPRGLVLVIAAVGVVFTALLVVVLFALLGGGGASPETPADGDVPATETPVGEAPDPGPGAA